MAKRLARPIVLLGLATLYLVTIYPLFGQYNDLPGGDNFPYHLPVYIYFTQILERFDTFPAWYPWGGGSPVTATSFSYFPFSPHRLLAYFIDWKFQLQPLFSYKLNLWIGMILIATGWFLVLHRLTGNLIAGAIGLFAFLLSGASVTFNHQEQIIATMTFFPWLALALLWVEERPALLLLIPTLAALGLTTHYPGIFSVSLTLLFLTALMAGLHGRMLALLRTHWRYWLPGVLLGLIALAPGFDLMQLVKQMASPVRETSSFEHVDFEHFMRMNTQQLSSAFFDYVLDIFYANAQAQYSPDQYGFYFMTPFWFIIAWTLVRPARIWPLFVLLALFLWASTGIYYYFAQILFHLHFPMIKYFRQWYHFFPYVQFTLSALTALGAAAILQKPSALRAALLAAVLLTAAYLARIQLIEPYIATHTATSDLTRFTPEQSNRFLVGFSGTGPHTILSYKASARLQASCKDKSFPVDLVPPLTNDQAYPIWREACFGAYRTLELSPSGEVRLSSLDDVKALPDGLEWRQPQGRFTGLLLLPVAEDFQAQIVDENGQALSRSSLFGGAFTAVEVGSGMAKVTAKLNRHQIYRAYYLQLAAVLTALILTFYFFRSRATIK